MNPRRVWTCALPVVVALLASGCIIARPRWQATWNDPWHNGWLDPGTPMAAPPPPAVAAMHTGPMGVGGAGQVWVDGHYEWIGGQYQWIGGHWVQPPQPGWAWQQPAWRNGHWHRGHWHAPVAQPVVAHRNGWNGGVVGQQPLPVAQPVTLSTGAVVAQPSVSVTTSFGGSVGGTVVAQPVR